MPFARVARSLSGDGNNPEVLSLGPESGSGRGSSGSPHWCCSDYLVMHHQS